MSLEMNPNGPFPGDSAFRRESLKGTQWEPTYAGALSFMRRKYSRDLKGVDIAVTGIPFDQAVSHRSGTRMGPEGIRKASAENAWGPFWPWNFDPFDTLAVIDYGLEHSLLWVVAKDDNGEIWCVPNEGVRMQKNWSAGRLVE